MFTLIWNNEIIEVVEDRAIAEYLKAEYSMAFKSDNIQIVENWG